MTMLQRCDPEDTDKLSEAELEELIGEVMKAYEGPESTKDPFMSPMLATPDMLTGLPPVHLVVRCTECHLLWIESLVIGIYNPCT